MKFEDVLDDIEGLVGKELVSIEASTNNIVITKIDREHGKYYVSSHDKPNTVKSRTFRELNIIWDVLSTNGYVHVDSALGGAGSSRNQPETIFANLPYIQHFKYQRKKHLLLRKKVVHESGTIKVLDNSELRIIKRQIDNRLAFDNVSFSVDQRSIIDKLASSLDTVFSKYPGDAIVHEVKNSLFELDTLQKIIESSVVTLDNIECINQSISESDKKQLVLEELINDESFTGIENEQNSDSTAQQTLNSLSLIRKAKIRTATPTCSLLFDRIKYNEIELQPDFQRKDRIWDSTRKSKLIESMLMGLPLPLFYFGEKVDNSWIVIDGLQRLTTIYDYMQGEFSLKNLEVLPNCNDKNFSQLDRMDQRKIREHQITAYLVDLDSDSEDLVIELFHRINTYGVKLSAQEIRSALNQGSSVTFLRYMAGWEVFKKSTNYRIKSDRQKDMELCLGAIAFIILGYEDFNYSRYDAFLSEVMKVLNKYELTVLNESFMDDGKAELILPCSELFLDLEKKLTLALELAYRVFGSSAFRKDRHAKGNAPISKPLFELIVAYFSFFNVEQTQLVIDHKDKLIDCLYTAIEDDSKVFATWDSDIYESNDRGFSYAISTSTGKRVTIKYRFDAMRKIIKKSTNIDVDILPLLKKYQISNTERKF